MVKLHIWPHSSWIPYCWEHCTWLWSQIPTVWRTMFEGRSPACSQSCKIVRLPPSGIGSDSAICVCTWKAKQRSHDHLTHSHPCFYLIIADSSRIVSNLMRRMNCTRRYRMHSDNIVYYMVLPSFIPLRQQVQSSHYINNFVKHHACALYTACLFIWRIYGKDTKKKKDHNNLSQ